MEWQWYQCRAYHQYGKTACTGQGISEAVARRAVEHFITSVLQEGIDLPRTLRESADEMAQEGDRLQSLRAEIAEAETGLRRLAHAVAMGQLDAEAARAETMELQERRERAKTRLEATLSGDQMGGQLVAAVALVQGDLHSVIAEMDREKFRDVVHLVLKKFCVVASGGSRNRKGEIVSHEFTPEFQELWLTHSNGVVGLDGQNQELAQPLNSACSSID